MKINKFLDFVILGSFDESTNAMTKIESSRSSTERDFLAVS